MIEFLTVVAYTLLGGLLALEILGWILGSYVGKWTDEEPEEWE